MAAASTERHIQYLRKTSADGQSSAWQSASSTETVWVILDFSEAKRAHTWAECIPLDEISQLDQTAANREFPSNSQKANIISGRPTRTPTPKTNGSIRVEHGLQSTAETVLKVNIHHIYQD
jgi:hypothetical protein